MLATTSSFEHRPVPFTISLAHVVQHIAQRGLLKAIHAQAIVLLDLDPRANVLALVRFTLRQPFGRVVVAFRTIAAGAHGEQLRTGEAEGKRCQQLNFVWYRIERAGHSLVGELFAARRGPAPRAGDPGLSLFKGSVCISHDVKPCHIFARPLSSLSSIAAAGSRGLHHQARKGLTKGTT